jgi:hypothetical protein
MAGGFKADKCDRCGQTASQRKNETAKAGDLRECPECWIRLCPECYAFHQTIVTQIHNQD